jgi:hypothetical protein
MPMTSPSAFSGCRSREKCFPPPRLGLLNFPARPRVDILASLVLSFCQVGVEGFFEKDVERQLVLFLGSRGEGCCLGVCGGDDVGGGGGDVCVWVLAG